MRTVHTIAALIVLTVGITVALFYLLRESSPPAMENNPANAVAPQAPAPSESTPANEEIELLRTELDQAQRRVAELEAQADLSNAATPPTPDPAPETAPADPDQKKATLEEIRAKMGQNPGVSAQIQALTEMLYAELFTGLNLDPDTKTSLRQLLLDSQLEEIALAQYAMQLEDASWKEVTQWRDEERARLAEQTRVLLTEEQQATWNEFAAQIDERALESTLNNQIRAFASGLTEENFDAVMQVAVEEFRAEQLALEQSSAAFTLAENVNYQIRAMDTMRERLKPALPADQYAEIENWLTMGQNLLTASLPKDPPE